MSNDSNSTHEIIQSVLQFAGGIFTALFVYMGIRYQYRKKKEDGKLEGGLQDNIAEERVLHFEVTKKLQDQANRVRAIDRLNRALREVFLTTNVDRFLVILALNGKYHYKTVSVFYQKHQDEDNEDDAVKKYRNVEIDAHYKKMLDDAEDYGVVDIYLDKIKGTLLGNIYMDEGITQSRVYFLDRVQLEEPGKDVMFFMSLATHLKEGLTERCKYRSNLIVNSRVKTYIKEITKEL